MFPKLFFSIFVILNNGLLPVYPLDNGLALTPPMGWMAWERFRCVTDCSKFPDQCISEKLFQRMARLLVSEGYAQVGYKYIIIDDCWTEHYRNKTTGKLVPSRRRFPSGLKSLADYIHKRGLKFGIYHNVGKRTCMNYGPGAAGHYKLDAHSFAQWEVDYVKLDGCYIQQNEIDKAYIDFGKALNRTNRPMVYSCSWPFYKKHPDYRLVKEHCNLWRFAQDVRDSHESVVGILKFYQLQQSSLKRHIGPGHWNDADMLMLGNYFLSYDASRLQLALWAVLASPLIMSNDLQSVRPEIKELLQNRDAIKVNQDVLGLPGTCQLVENTFHVCLRRIQPVNSIGHHSYAVAFVNPDSLDECPLCTQTIQIVLKELSLNNSVGYKVVDIFNSSNNLGIFKPRDNFSTRINPGGVTFYKFTAVEVY